MNGPDTQLSERHSCLVDSRIFSVYQQVEQKVVDDEALLSSLGPDSAKLPSSPTPVKCMTELAQHCISAFQENKGGDFWPPSKLPQFRGNFKRRSSGVLEEFKRVSAEEAFCTPPPPGLCEVRFHWLKAGPSAENLSYEGDARCRRTLKEHTITWPMVCLDRASTGPSHKANKGWEIIKSGMDYVLGRSIIPQQQKAKLSKTSPSSGKVVPDPSTRKSLPYHRAQHTDTSIVPSAVYQMTPEISSAPQAPSAEEFRGLIKTPFFFRRNAAAGALAGMCVSLCLHPVDTVKTVIQAQSIGQRSVLNTLITLISQRGFLGLYRGLGSNLASSGPISAIYTFTYESVKAALLPQLPKEYHALAHCMAGGFASVATSIVYTPSECVKQRMQVGSLYRNSWLAFLGILKDGGLSVLYSGWGAVLCRNVPQSVIKFYTYEGLKNHVLRDGTTLTTCQTLAFGGLAGSTAALFTTPFDVIKTRLQTQIPGSVLLHKGVLRAFYHIATTEGLGGLYRGLIPRLVIYVSQGALFFASYEFFKQLLAMKVHDSSDGRFERKESNRLEILGS